jgi:hypothetical protein
MTKKVRFLFMLLLLTATAQCFGANFYVRKGATGSNNGSSWTDAWNELNQIGFSSVACGDTVWIAGGTYNTVLTVSKTCTSSNPLTINRVRSTDAAPIAAAGWDSSFDSQVVILNGSIDIPQASYVSINGRVGSVASNNYGISVRCTTTSGCMAVSGAESGNLSNISLSYIEMYGPPCVTAGNCGGSAEEDGLNLAPSSNKVTNLLVDHNWIHRWAESIRTCNWNGATIQYTDIDTEAQTPNEHEDVIFSYDISNLTFRYNRVHTSPNDGIFFDGNETNSQFYGNVYYHAGGALFTFFSGFTHNVYMYNNVFENDGTYGDYQPAWLYFQGQMTGEIANNVWLNVNQNGACPICNHNAYSLGAPSGQSGSFSFSPGAQFVNESASNPSVADFHLTAAGASSFANKGKTLAAPFNVDPDGNVRGADGGWDIGAYEYQGTGGGPMPPTALTGVAK